MRCLRIIPTHAATASALGLVKIGSNLTIVSGLLSLTKANVTAALGYTPPTTNTTYGNATQRAAGLMSAADKKRSWTGSAATSPLAVQIILDSVMAHRFAGSNSTAGLTREYHPYFPFPVPFVDTNYGAGFALGEKHNLQYRHKMLRIRPYYYWIMCIQ